MTITIADGRGALWQWDTGRRLRVGSGVEQIHYQNRALGGSVDVNVGADGTAIIPDELLQDCHTLTAYAYVTDDTGAYTMVQVDFAVHKRAKPAGYVYTPTDQMTLQTIQRQIGDLADLTTTAKDTLVAAINEAARTGGGAGSMDLRVADGYIQYSTGGGGTWQSLIAVADLKGAKGDKGDPGAPGAPGKDGSTPKIAATKTGKVTSITADGVEIAQIKDGADATADPSLGITGATPGQIAKITAVDETGKPTAWEPVEIAGGGGADDEVWEIIEDITLNEDAAYTSPVNDNYSEYVIFISCPAVDTQVGSGNSSVLGNSLPIYYIALSNKDRVKMTTIFVKRTTAGHALFSRGAFFTSTAVHDRPKTYAALDSVSQLCMESVVSAYTPVLKIPVTLPATTHIVISGRKK